MVLVRAPAGRSRTAELELSGPTAAQLYVHSGPRCFRRCTQSHSCVGGSSPRLDALGCGSSFYLYRPFVRVRCVGGVCCMKILVLSKHPPIAKARRRAHRYSYSRTFAGAATRGSRVDRRSGWVSRLQLTPTSWKLLHFQFVWLGESVAHTYILEALTFPVR